MEVRGEYNRRSPNRQKQRFRSYKRALVLERDFGVVSLSRLRLTASVPLLCRTEI